MFADNNTLVQKHVIAFVYLDFGEEYIITLEKGQYLMISDGMGITEGTHEEKAFW